MAREQLNSCNADGLSEADIQQQEANIYSLQETVATCEETLEQITERIQRTHLAADPVPMVAAVCVCFCI